MGSYECSAESTKILCCWCNCPSPGANCCQKCFKPCHSVPPCSFSIAEAGNRATVTCFNCWLIFENSIDAKPFKSSEFAAKKHENSKMSPFIDNQNVSEVKSEPTVSKNPRRRRVFTIKEKLSILDFAKESSVHAASRQFNVDRSSIQDWKRQETELRQMFESEKRKRLLGGGRKLCDPKFDETLSNWVRNLQGQKVRVTRNMIVSRAQQLSTNYNSMKKFTASNGWLEKFMQRHNFSLCTPTTFSMEQTNSGQMGGGNEPSVDV